MKASTLRIFLSVHTWVGLASGILLFIAFYAGAITVFVEELQGWGKPRVELSRAQALEQAQQLLLTALAEREISGEPSLILPGPRTDVPALYYTRSDTSARHKLVLNPDGSLHETPLRSGAIDFVYDLHFTAGLPHTLGNYLFGIVCLLYGLALVSGVVIYAPVFLKDLFALRVERNIKRMWQDAHNVIGVLSLPFHIIFAWSGAVLTIGFLMLIPYQFLVFENKLLTVLEPSFELVPHQAEAGVERAMLTVAELVQRAEAALPGLHVQSISIHDPGDANAIASAYGAIEQHTLNHSGGVAINAATGEVLKALGPQDFPPGMSALRGLQTLHFGNFGGFAVKWLYFLLGLAGAFLFYGGNLLWIEARRKRRQVQQPRRTRFVASLTIGTCLGSVAGVSAVFITGALAAEIWVPRVYWLVFALCTLWAFVRRPAHTAHELLWLCTLLTIAVPLAGWIGSNELPWARIAQGDWQQPLIDATAIVMATAFARMAVATLRRGRSGDPHSVWAL